MDNSHSDWHEMVPHCGFDLHFSDYEWCWASFHVFVSHLYVFFGEMSVYFFGPFLIGSFIFLELSYRSCLYNFEINSLSVAPFVIIFSHSEGCLFTLLIVSFVVHKLLILIRSHLFIFAFISNILGGIHTFLNLFKYVIFCNAIFKILIFSLMFCVYVCYVYILLIFCYFIFYGRIAL